VFGQFVFGQGMRKKAGAKHPVITIEETFPFVVNGHGAPFVNPAVIAR
jgi:hypothetical protein